MSFNVTEAEHLLVETGRQCCICHTLHRVQLHHILPTENGGSDDIDNAIPLCPNCHDEVHTGYIPGRVTKKYTSSELKNHRQRTMNQVKSGIFPTSGNEQSTNPAKIKAAQQLYEATTRLYHEVSYFIANNIDLAPNDEWRQLHQSLSSFSDTISNHEWMFSEAVNRAARDIYDCYRETVSGINAGNSHRNYYNNYITVEGTDMRNASWTKFDQRLPELRHRLADALRAEMQI